MYWILAILILIASVLLIGVVLIQKSKGGGLVSSASSLNSMGGVRQTTDFIEKATWSLAIIICVLSIVTSFIAPSVTDVNAPQIKKLPTSEQQATPFGNTEEAATPAQSAAPAADAKAEAAPAADAKAAAPAEAPADKK